MPAPHMLSAKEKAKVMNLLLQTFFAKGSIGHGVSRADIEKMMQRPWRLIPLDPKHVDPCHAKAVKWIAAESKKHAKKTGQPPVSFPFRKQPIIIGPRQIGERTYSDMTCVLGDPRYMILDGYHRTAAAIRDDEPIIWGYVIDLDGNGTAWI